MVDGIQHPRFLRLSKTEYAISNPNSTYRWYVHVGQIKNYLAFDKILREDKGPADFPGIPLGYADFVTAFNTGTHPQDSRRISSYILIRAGDQIIKPTNPVFLEDFHITPEQCGLATTRRNLNGLTEAQAMVFEEYATI